MPLVQADCIKVTACLVIPRAVSVYTLVLSSPRFCGGFGTDAALTKRLLLQASFLKLQKKCLPLSCLRLSTFYARKRYCLILLSIRSFGDSNYFCWCKLDFYFKVLRLAECFPALHDCYAESWFKVAMCCCLSLKYRAGILSRRLAWWGRHPGQTVHSQMVPFSFILGIYIFFAGCT